MFHPDSYENIQFDTMVNLVKLKYLYINLNNISFDRFEIFVRKCCCQLEIMSIKTDDFDINYLNNDKWKELILEHIIDLKHLDFSFYIGGSKTTFDYFTNGHHALSHWINKKWFSQLFVEDYYLIYRLSAFK